MPLFQSQKFQRLAELEARVQKAIEEAGAGGLDWAEEELAGTAAAVGFDLEVARVLDGATLLTVLGAGGAQDPGRLWLAAETLYLDGIVARAEGREDDALDRFGKARRLYGRVGGDLHLPAGAASPGERLRALDRLTG